MIIVLLMHALQAQVEYQRVHDLVAQVFESRLDNVTWEYVQGGQA